MRTRRRVRPSPFESRRVAVWGRRSRAGGLRHDRREADRYRRVAPSQDWPRERPGRPALHGGPVRRIRDHDHGRGRGLNPVDAQAVAAPVHGGHFLGDEQRLPQDPAGGVLNHDRAKQLQPQPQGGLRDLRKKQVMTVGQMTHHRVRVRAQVDEALLLGARIRPVPWCATGAPRPGEQEPQGRRPPVVRGRAPRPVPRPAHGSCPLARVGRPAGARTRPPSGRSERVPRPIRPTGRSPGGSGPPPPGKCTQVPAGHPAGPRAEPASAVAGAGLARGDT